MLSLSQQRVRKALLRGGLATALSVLFLAELDRQYHMKEDDDDDFFYDEEKKLWCLTRTDTGSTPPPPPAAAFDKSKLQPKPLTSHITRQRTLLMMEDTSCPTALESRYVVNWRRVLGEGAFGAVYPARDRTTGEKVAVKKIPKKLTDDMGFQREMNALNHLRATGGHPNICGLRENFDEGDHYFLALDLVAGGEMFDHLVKLGAYSEADAARLVREVARALAFLHGIDVVHGDLKPENLMLSTQQASDAVIKLVDFGCSQVLAEDSTIDVSESKKLAQTPAYSPPEVLGVNKPDIMESSVDMWALGVILFIMLTGLHPFDLNGKTSDEEIARRILEHEAPPLRDSPITAHLSDSAIDLMEKLMAWDPEERITALQMLEHPWVQGETATQDKIAGSDKRLSMYHAYKSRLEAEVFANIVSWSEKANRDDVPRTSLIERSFQSLDPQGKGFITTTDLRKLSKGGKPLSEPSAEPMSLSSFEDLLSDNMKNKYFPKNHVVYEEGDEGHHMYIISSGTVEVTTKDGTVSRRTQGDFFGEGALLGAGKIRSGSIKCITPVHAIEISREYFEKYLASSDSGLKMTLREKDKIRKRNRAKSILRLQNNLKSKTVKKGEYLYKVGEKGSEMYILSDGVVDVTVGGHTVFTMDKAGNMCGEHSLITGRLRNTSAACVSDTCKVQVMRARDFHDLMDSSASLKESIREICLRREFLKALVFKTNKPFPSDPNDLKEAFEAADEDKVGKISLKNIRSMLKRYDPTIEEEDLVDIIESLDIGQTGAVSFEAFKRIFGIDEHQATAM